MDAAYREKLTWDIEGGLRTDDQRAIVIWDPFNKYSDDDIMAASVLCDEIVNRYRRAPLVLRRSPNQVGVVIDATTGAPLVKVGTDDQALRLSKDYTVARAKVATHPSWTRDQ